MVILLTGTDQYRIEQVINNYKAKLNPLYLSLNYHRFRAEQLDSAITAARTIPFCVGYKLIVISDCDFKQFNNETHFTLFKCLSQLPKNTVLIFTAKSIDKRLKVVKDILKYARHQEFNLLSPWRTDLIANYIRSQAREINLKLDGKSVNYLAVAIGNDTTRIHSELNKLALCSQNSPVNFTQIQELIPHTNQTCIELAEAIRLGNAERTIYLTQSLLSQAHHPLVIVATLITQFRTWLWVSSALQHTNNDTEIAQLCHLGNLGRIYYLRQEVQNLSQRSLCEVLTKLLDLEVALKTGRSAELILPTFLLLSNQLRRKK